jgi:hypothetical protein
MDKHFGIDIKIEKIEESEMETDGDAFIFYVKIINNSPKNRKIRVPLVNYITSKGEQLEQDSWLTGYFMHEDTLKPNVFKKTGIIFNKSKLKSIKEDDLFYICVQLLNEGQELTLCFQRKGNKWQIANEDVTEIEVNLTPKQFEKNLLNKIERLEVFEEKFGVYFENLSIKMKDADDQWFSIFGEFHLVNGTNIDDDLTIECIIYDNEGLILLKEVYYIWSESFFGFEVIEFVIQEDGIAEKVGKIRIFPKNRS